MGAGRATEAPWCTVKTFIAAVGSRSPERQQAALRCYLPKHQEKAGGGERQLRGSHTWDVADATRNK